MIIPPDPEKDPNAFSASASTTSLVPPPSDSDSDSLQPPQPARTRNGAFGYPYGDDLGVGYNGEALPPYQRERLEGGNLFADPPVMRERVNRFSVTQPSITIPTTATRTEPQVAPSPLSPDDELTPIASTSTTRLPFTVVPISGAPASTSKLWESSSTTSTGNVSNSRFLVPAPSVRRWWKKWRKWVYIAIGLLLAGLGLMIGMLVGVGTGEHEDQSKDMAAWKDVSGDGQRANWVTSGESLNITYIPSRDGPQGNEGNLTTCPIFYPLNSSDPVHLLATPFPAQKLSYATFQFPLAKNGTDPQVLADFTMFARGLGSSGTVEIIGAEAPREVINAGREGFVSIDVVAMYSGKQDLNNLIKVCELARENNSLGLGIFTPKETDGKVSNAYMLNPADLPSFHVVVRLPPSALLAPETANIVIPRMTFELDRMAVRLGNLHNVVDFGDLSIDSIRGGVTVGYAAAETISIRTGENAVRGRFNISESISVNCTEGTILAELILFDPESNAHTVVFDPPSALYKRDQLEARGPFDASTSSDNDTIPAEPVKKRISTSFVTGDGLLDISYVYQAPTVILSAFIATGEGEVSVALHPNYVGPFVALNGWGQIRLPQPKELYDIDPLGLGRRRQVSIGPFDPDENGLFARKQLNATSLKTSMAVSGAAYWAPNGNTSTPQEVVDEDAVDGSEGSEVLILGAWGDVRLTADAT